MSLEPDATEALLELLRAKSDVTAISEVEQLTGGASRQTYAIDAMDDQGPVALVLQREISPEPRLANGMADEAELVRVARAAGVPAPTVVCSNLDGAPALGNSFFITRTVPGETIARRILRDDRFHHARRALPTQLGTALAALHTGVDPADVGWLEVTDQIAHYRDVVEELDLVSPAFELGFRWLEANRPDPSTDHHTVVHGDFRLGNLIIDESGLAAVIDWELGHLGDPMEDLGWLCVRAWRFGGPQPVAGVGRYRELFDAYEAASGRPVDPEAVRWWETVGTLKWGIMCGTQANRHLSGDVPSVELASIGPRVAEQEYDVLRLIHPDPSARAQSRPGPTPVERGHATGFGEGGGRPSAGELLDAVRDFLLGDVSGATDGRTRFHTRVAANTLAIIGRELALADDIGARRQARLTGLGYSTERELAAAIAAGTLDDRLPEVAESVMASVIDRLTVNNPGWLLSG